MRTCIRFLLLCIFANQGVFAGQELEIDDLTPDVQQNSDENRYSCDELHQKVHGFTNMRNAGFALLGGGVGLGVIGACMIASANGTAYYQNTNGEESGSLTGGLGACFLGIGIPMVIVGAILTPLGFRKIREYNYRLKDQHCKFSLDLNGSSVCILYSF
jgi:hypothetical protein